MAIAVAVTTALMLLNQQNESSTTSTIIPSITNQSSTGTTGNISLSTTVTIIGASSKYHVDEECYRYILYSLTKKRYGEKQEQF